MATPVTIPVHGSVVPGFEPIREVFAANFTRLGEEGDRRDAVLVYPTRWASGFMLPNAIEPVLGPGSFVLDALEGCLR